jgi:hypothetical protein
MPLVLRLWFAGCLLLAAAVHADVNDLRFSVSLKPEERTAIGLARLTSDEAAVLDALVRRDTTVVSTGSNTTKLADRFTERLTAGERQTAGLQKLTPAETAQLNALVDRHQNARLARTLLAPPSYLARNRTVVPSEGKKEREIHGSFTLSYGFGSGGYSEKTGSIELYHQDPAGKYLISVGYTESHIKGGSVYRDPYYDLPRGPLLEGAAAPRP